MTFRVPSLEALLGPEILFSNSLVPTSSFDGKLIALFNFNPSDNNDENSKFIEFLRSGEGEMLAISILEFDGTTMPFGFIANDTKRQEIIERYKFDTSVSRRCCIITSNGIPRVSNVIPLLNRNPVPPFLWNSNLNTVIVNTTTLPNNRQITPALLHEYSSYVWMNPETLISNGIYPNDYVCLRSASDSFFGIVNPPDFPPDIEQYNQVDMSDEPIIESPILPTEGIVCLSVHDLQLLGVTSGDTVFIEHVELGEASEVEIHVTNMNEGEDENTINEDLSKYFGIMGTSNIPNNSTIATALREVGLNFNESSVWLNQYVQRSHCPHRPIWIGEEIIFPSFSVVITLISPNNSTLRNASIFIPSTKISLNI